MQVIYNKDFEFALNDMIGKVQRLKTVAPIDSTSAGTAILLAVIGNWATMVSDGTNWVIMQAASNNNLLLE